MGNVISGCGSSGNLMSCTSISTSGAGISPFAWSLLQFSTGKK